LVVSGTDDAIDVRVVPHFREIMEGRSRAHVAVDMPIGLPATRGPRGCDRLARARLGRRASCVFTPPTRRQLEARDVARRISLDEAERVPGRPPRDRRRLRMEIWF